MRYVCYFCSKSVSSELPHDAVIRALLVCPECIEHELIFKFSNREPVQQVFDFEKDVNDGKEKL